MAGAGQQLSLLGGTGVPPKEVKPLVAGGRWGLLGVHAQAFGLWEREGVLLGRGRKLFAKIHLREAVCGSLGEKECGECQRPHPSSMSSLSKRRRWENQELPASSGSGQ
jgi:hypothetical protein